MIRRTILALVALVTMYASSAGAQATCGDRTSMVEKLVNKYHEMQMGLGLRRGGSRLIEVWANCTTGTWTIMKIYPDGTACVMAVGEGWQGRGCKTRQPIKGASA